MTRDEILAAVRSVADEGTCDPHTQNGDYITITVAEAQRFATLIRNQTLDEIASKMAGFTWFDGDDAAAEIRSMKT